MPGTAALTGRMLAEGTSRRSWSELAEFTEGHGISLSAVGGLESHGLAIDCLDTDWQLAVDLAVELLLDSQFSEPRVDWQRQQTLAELRSLADQPDVRTSWKFLEQLYRPFALARPLQGLPETVSGLGRDDCRSFHEASLGRGGLLVTAGAASAELVQARVEGGFDGRFELATASSAVLETPDLDGEGQAVAEVPLPDSRQLHLFAGHLTVPKMHPDAPALETLGVVLGAGSGLNGRFPQRLREQEGLGYVAHAHALAGAGRAPGRFLVYLGTTPEHRERAERCIR